MTVSRKEVGIAESKLKRLSVQLTNNSDGLGRHLSEEV